MLPLWMSWYVRGQREEAVSQDQFKPALLVADVKSMSSIRVTNEIDKSTQFVPASFRYSGGFSCTSMSSQNKNHAAYKGCVQNEDKEAQTFVTFEGVFAYIRRLLPVLFMLENVTALAQKNEGGR